MERTGASSRKTERPRGLFAEGTTFSAAAAATADALEEDMARAEWGGVEM